MSVRRRLILTYVTLLAVVLVGLAVPLAVAVAGTEGNRMYADRQADTARFAALAEPALRTGRTDPLGAELRQYDSLFRIAAVVISRDGTVVLASRETIDYDDPALREAVDAALAGQRAGAAPRVWPWRGDPMMVAEPVGLGGEILGAVVTISPVGAVTATVWRSWAVLVGLGAVVLAISVVAAVPLAGWLLAPVRQLDQAAHALAAGRFGDRALAVPGPPELQRLTASFNTMADRIATLVERQRSFVSYASHQLRTPLATLRLWVENLGHSVTPAGRADHEMVVAEVERMGEMCDALLTYARAEATAADVSDLDASEVAAERVAVWRQAAARAGIALTLAGAGHAPVRAAPQALDQALDALLNNAIKYAGRGAEVTVQVVVRDGWVDVHVIDDGPGIPAADLAHAAQPFWREHPGSGVEGSGLGITVADALVTASGGELELGTARPHGLHARIGLPAARRAAAPGVARGRATPPPVAADSGAQP